MIEYTDIKTFLTDICCKRESGPPITYLEIQKGLSHITDGFNIDRCKAAISVIEEYKNNVEAGYVKLKNELSQDSDIKDYSYIVKEYKLDGSMLELKIDISLIGEYVDPTQISIADLILYVIQRNIDTTNISNLEYALRLLQEKIEEAKDKTKSTAKRGRPRIIFENCINKEVDADNIKEIVRSFCKSKVNGKPRESKTVRMVMQALMELGALESMPSHTAYNECFHDCTQVTADYKKGKNLEKDSEYIKVKNKIESLLKENS